MPDANDMDLIRQFARDNSEAAFTELVRRHINLVYSVARRCTGNDGDAHDVTQAVFIILARKAAGLREKTLLTGWLYETTRFAAARLLRTNARRHAREQEAYMQSTLNEADTAAIWEKLSPHLETAMGKLNAADRTLLVLRFYENKSGPETAALLGIREDAAHKRVTRAIEKLRKVFAQRGVTLSGAAIAGAVSANSVQAAPVGLALTIKAVALAAAATETFGLLQFMTMSKLKLGISTLAIAGVTTVFVVQHQVQIKLREGNELLRQQITQLQTDNESLSNRLMAIGDSKKLTDEQFIELLKLRGEVGVLRNQIAAAALSPSDLATDSWQSRFDAVYKLKTDEVVRYIAPPFIPERSEYYHKTEEWHDSAEHISTPPDFFIFHQDTNGLFHRHGTDGGFGYKQHSLQQVLNATLGINESELEAPKELLDLNLPGDWTIRDGVSRETFLAALEPILLKATGHPIHFEKRMTERDAIIAQGQFTLEAWEKAQPIQIFSETTNYTKAGFLGGGAGDLQEFLKKVGDRLNIYIVNEAQTDSRLPEPLQFQWNYHADADAPRMGNRRAELTDKVLNNLAEQTGLSFTHTNQAVEVWAITEQP
jgi:RNA polymerase sigma factor (sigma-70 family)